MALSGLLPRGARRRRLSGRPEFYTSYAQDMALVNTPPKRRALGALAVGALLLPFVLTDDLLQLLATAFVAAIGAIGLNLVTGYAGQVSLGHAFFLAIGAYTAAVLNGEQSATSDVIGYGLDMWAWLPVAGLVAAAAGL